MPDIIDKIIDDSLETRLTVNGKEYVIKKFNAINTFRIGKFIAKIGKTYSKELIKFMGSETDIADMIVLLNLISEEDFLELISVFLCEPDKTICSQIERDDLVKLVTAVLRHNDFMAFLKNAPRVISKALIEGQVKKSSWLPWKRRQS
jgi:hypothetical protein